MEVWKVISSATPNFEGIFFNENLLEENFFNENLLENSTWENSGISILLKLLSKAGKVRSQYRKDIFSEIETKRLEN